MGQLPALRLQDIEDARVGNPRHIDPGEQRAQLRAGRNVRQARRNHHPCRHGSNIHSNTDIPGSISECRWCTHGRTPSRPVSSVQLALHLWLGEEDASADERHPDPAVLGRRAPEKRLELLRLLVGERERAVERARAVADEGPGRAVSLVGDEREVRPRLVGGAVGQQVPDIPQGRLLVSERRGGDLVPAARVHTHRALPPSLIGNGVPGHGRGGRRATGTPLTTAQRAGPATAVAVSSSWRRSSDPM
jgi:hypothetical protein